MNAKGKTYSRVEHIDGGDGIRFSYIARYVAPGGGDTLYDPNWYRTTEKRHDLLRKLLDALKAMPLFWR